MISSIPQFQGVYAFSTTIDGPDYQGAIKLFTTALKTGVSPAPIGSNALASISKHKNIPTKVVPVANENAKDIYSYLECEQRLKQFPQLDFDTYLPPGSSSLVFVGKDVRNDEGKAVTHDNTDALEQKLLCAIGEFYKHNEQCQNRPIPKIASYQLLPFFSRFYPFH